MSLELRAMVAADHAAAAALWVAVPGLVHVPEDDEAAVARLLAHNPGLSSVATADGVLVGTLLCGHDGRRGYLYHLAVADSQRGRGVGRALVDRSLAELHRHGIRSVRSFVFAANADALGFWHRVGWEERRDVVYIARDLW